jgi:hypothetical protein
MGPVACVVAATAALACDAGEAAGADAAIGMARASTSANGMNDIVILFLRAFIITVAVRRT